MALAETMPGRAATTAPTLLNHPAMMRGLRQLAVVASSARTSNTSPGAISAAMVLRTSAGSNSFDVSDLKADDDSTEGGVPWFLGDVGICPFCAQVVRIGVDAMGTD